MKKALIIAAAILVFLAIAFGAMRLIDRGNVGPPTPGPDTTFVSGPLKSSGYVDYFAAYNEIRGSEVKPQENGAIEFLLAVGCENKQVDDHFRSAWEILTCDLDDEDPRKRIPEDHRFFMTLEEFLESKGIEDGPLNAEDDSAATIFDSYLDEADVCIANPWRKDEFPIVAEWIDRNSKSLELIKIASSFPRFWMPAVKRPDASKDAILFEQDQEAIYHSRKLIPCLLTRAMLYLGKGDIDTCQDDLIVARRLSRLLTQNSNMTQGLVGMQVQRMTSRTEGFMITHANLDSKQVERYEELLNDLPESGALAETFDFEERLGSLSALQQVHERASQFDVDVSMQMMNEVYDHLAGATREPPVAESERWIEAYFDERDAKPNFNLFEWLGGRKAKGRVMGRLTIRMMFPAIGPVRNAYLDAEIRIKMIKIGMKIERFRIANGTYPKELTEMIPGQMQEIAADPFGEGPLQYRKTDEGYILYSVGYNQIDDGGYSYDDEIEETYPDDIRLLIGVLNLKNPEDENGKD